VLRPDAPPIAPNAKTASTTIRAPVARTLPAAGQACSPRLLPQCRTAADRAAGACKDTARSVHQKADTEPHHQGASGSRRALAGWRVGPDTEESRPRSLQPCGGGGAVRFRRWRWRSLDAGDGFSAHAHRQTQCTAVCAQIKPGTVQGALRRRKSLKEGVPPHLMLSVADPSPPRNRGHLCRRVQVRSHKRSHGSATGLLPAQHFSQPAPPSRPPLRRWRRMRQIPD